MPYCTKNKNNLQIFLNMHVIDARPMTDRINMLIKKVEKLINMVKTTGEALEEYKKNTKALRLPERIEKIEEMIRKRKLIIKNKKLKKNICYQIEEFFSELLNTLKKILKKK